MKAFVVWLLVSGASHTTYSPPLASQADCVKLQSAIVSYEGRSYSKCVQVTILVD